MQKVTCAKGDKNGASNFLTLQYLKLWSPFEVPIWQRHTPLIVMFWRDLNLQSAVPEGTCIFIWLTIALLFLLRRSYKNSHYPRGHKLNKLIYHVESALPDDACILIWLILAQCCSLEKDFYNFFPQYPGIFPCKSLFPHFGPTIPLHGGHDLYKHESVIPDDACISMTITMHSPAVLEKNDFKDFFIYSHVKLESPILALSYPWGHDLDNIESQAST